jgi:hypothetical protein
MNQGLLTEDQVNTVLEAQQAMPRPFGVLAEELFGVPEADVEGAWAAQYAQLAERVPSGGFMPDAEALGCVSNRQAWQFRLAPWRFDGSELILVTTVDHLPGALRFAMRCIDRPCAFAITDEQTLGVALEQHMPMGGLTAKDLNNPMGDFSTHPSWPSRVSA